MMMVIWMNGFFFGWMLDDPYMWRCIASSRSTEIMRFLFGGFRRSQREYEKKNDKVIRSGKIMHLLFEICIVLVWFYF